MINIKNQCEIEKMEIASNIIMKVLNIIEKKYIKPGISTKEIDDIIFENILKFGGYPSFLKYNGFPASSCISINNEIIHGIPKSNKFLHDGDIVSIDLGVKFDGYHSDCARTYCCGNINKEILKLINVTKESFFQGLSVAYVNNKISDISYKIQNYIESNNFSVVKSFVGHGIGSKLHESPEIPNFWMPNCNIKLKSGMTLAIEPMVTQGDSEILILPDKWTVVTKDKKLSAHYENTILITENGPKILTKDILNDE